MMHSAETESACFSLPRTQIYHLPKRSRMNSSPTSFALIWNLDKNPIKGGHPRVITGSLANHKGESLQAAAATAKKRSTASDENRTQTRAHCVCYLSAQWAVSFFGTGVRSSAFIATTCIWPHGRVELQLKRPRRGRGDRNTRPGVLLLGSSLRRS